MIPRLLSSLTIAERSSLLLTSRLSMHSTTSQLEASRAHGLKGWHAGAGGAGLNDAEEVVEEEEEEEEEYEDDEVEDEDDDEAEAAPPRAAAMAVSAIV
jgi:hypothetical protein